jgi:hypothetical protein
MLDIWDRRVIKPELSEFHGLKPQISGSPGVLDLDSSVLGPEMDRPGENLNFWPSEKLSLTRTAGLKIESLRVSSDDESVVQ